MTGKYLEKIVARKDLRTVLLRRVGLGSSQGVARTLGVRNMAVSAGR